MSQCVRRWSSLTSQRRTGPREAGGAGEHAAERPADVPRADHQDEAGERERDGRPLHPAQPLAEEQPRQQEQPERHGVHEHGDLAGAADDERRRGEPVEERGLQEADEQRPAEGRRPQGPASDGEDGEQADRPQPRDEPGERERSRVAQGDLADHPAVPPERGDDGEREHAEVAGAWCGWVGHVHPNPTRRRFAARACRRAGAGGRSSRRRGAAHPAVVGSGAAGSTRRPRRTPPRARGPARPLRQLQLGRLQLHRGAREPPPLGVDGGRREPARLRAQRGGAPAVLRAARRSPPATSRGR